jgi:hypothetical protein
MKILKWIAYVFAGIGAILVLIAIISALTLKHKIQAVYIASYLLAGNSFLLITAIILIFILLNQKMKA